MIRRRELITLLGGAAAWPLAAHAQQGERMRRIGVLMPGLAADSEARALVSELLQELQRRGWTEGHNVRIDYRWAAGNLNDLRKYAAELIALAPDLLVAGAGSAITPLQQATRSTPIVFAQAVDPVGAGQIASMARPGGNATGFIQFEYGFSGKWIELLKQIAPGMTRPAILRDATAPAGIGQWAIIQAAAQSLGVEVAPISVREADEIERAVAALAREPNGGLVVVVSTRSLVHRDLIIALAAKHRLPAVYPYRLFVRGGGLISYGPDLARPVPARRRLCRSNPQGRKAG